MLPSTVSIVSVLVGALLTFLAPDAGLFSFSAMIGSEISAARSAARISDGGCVEERMNLQDKARVLARARSDGAWNDTKDKRSFKGPYSSIVSVTLMIARNLRREVEWRDPSYNLD